MVSDEGCSGLRLREEHPPGPGLRGSGLALTRTEIRLSLPETRRNLGLGQRPFGRHWQAYATGPPVPGWRALGAGGQCRSRRTAGGVARCGLCIPDRQRLRVQGSKRTNAPSLALAHPGLGLGLCLPASPPLQPPCLPAWRWGAGALCGGVGVGDLTEHGAHVGRPRASSPRFVQDPCPSPLLSGAAAELVPAGIRHWAGATPAASGVPP